MTFGKALEALKAGKKLQEKVGMAKECISFLSMASVFTIRLLSVTVTELRSILQKFLIV